MSPSATSLDYFLEDSGDEYRCLCQAQLSKVLSPPKLDKPDGEGIWFFDGQLITEPVMNTTPCLVIVVANTGCIVAVYCSDNKWRSRERIFANKIENFKGTWQRAIVPE